MLKEIKVVITRPEQQGIALQQALNNIGIPSICQPLFHYQLNTTTEKVQSVIKSFSPDIIIFVSVAAVDFANQALPLKQWLDTQLVVAVGEQTKHALSVLEIDAICPENNNSEGILELPQLKQQPLNNNNSQPCILIVRGDGGREFLAEELKNRGAKAQYLESYQRVWLQLPLDQDEQWKNKKINAIVITSNALLQRVVDLLNMTDKYWQNTCLWIVASERIAQIAKKMGLKKVINSQGASSQSIVKTLLNMEFKND